jgi:hypothetical protein
VNGWKTRLVATLVGLATGAGCGRVVGDDQPTDADARAAGGSGIAGAPAGSGAPSSGGSVGPPGDCSTVCTLPHQTVTCVDETCQRGACDPGYADCVPDDPGRASTQGCETALLADSDNCGECGKICSSPWVCQAGVCAPAECSEGFANCDQDPLGTCETNLGADPANCGACGLVCSTNHGSPSCANRQCDIVCDGLYANCDNDVANGCEAALLTDPNHCSACDITCRNDRGTTRCVSGSCTPTCTSGSKDCDLDPTNGCEDVSSDVNNCGSCGRACSAVGGTPRCADGVCLISCSAGSADCNGSAVDGCEVNVAVDVNNCAACGHLCACPRGTPNCINGTCACPECGMWPYANCTGNDCVNNLNTEVLNCGACGHVCTVAHGTPACEAAQCVVAQCDRDASPAYEDCDGQYANGCETPLNTVTSCGDCNVACSPPHATGTCATGACAIQVCETGYADCNRDPADGCEANVNSDVGHCGGCGAANICPNLGGSARCRNGVCTTDCGLAHADCNGLAADGCEVNLASDPNNCGSCGKVCASAHGSPVCSGGMCAVELCNAGYADCDGVASNGCEVQLTTNVANCGACGHACIFPYATATCTGGTCAIQICVAGRGDCNGNAADGCEHDLGADSNNCGACGHVCSASTCVDGSCVS